jgi:pimeloyl-ACP methyl ester carboxylesterase
MDSQIITFCVVFMFSIARLIVKYFPSLAAFLGLKGSIVPVGDLEIWYESFGSCKDPCILLLMGAGCQGICWGDRFCEGLSRAGFFVIRYDQRDTGFSSYCNKKHPYNLIDMAKDAIGLLDVLQVTKAHLCGMSMGGGVAQLIAAHFPSRVKSVTLMMTTSDFGPIMRAFDGNCSEKMDLSFPKKEWLNWLEELENIPRFAIYSQVKKNLEGWEILNGSKTTFDRPYYKKLMKKSLLRQRSWRFFLHHKIALASSVLLIKETEGKITAPMLVVAGGEDPLFSLDHAKNLVSKNSGSRLHLIEEMGHNFNPCFHEDVIEFITEFIREKA